MTEKEKNEKSKELKKKIRNFCLMDDLYMNVFFDGQPKLIEIVLRIILDKQDLTVISSTMQKPYKNLLGHSLALDIVAVDSEGRQYDIEVQNDPAEASPQRARLHSSYMDQDMLMPKQSFSELPESYVIFILAKDYFKKGLPFYSADRSIKQLGNADFGDGSHIIYVNGEYKGEDALGQLMSDFNCRNTDDIHNEQLRQRTRYIKEPGGGNDTMCNVIKQLYGSEIDAASKASYLEGREEGVGMGVVKTVKKMLRLGKYTVEEISEASDLDIDSVLELKKALDNENM